MFYKLVNYISYPGYLRDLYSGHFCVYFDITPIFPRLQCLHCALERDKKSIRNIQQNQLNLISRTTLYFLQTILFTTPVYD